MHAECSHLALLVQQAEGVLALTIIECQIPE